MQRKFIAITSLFALAIFGSAKQTCAQLSVDSIRYIIQKEVEGKRSMSEVAGLITPKGKTVIAAGKTKKDGIEPDGNTIYEIGSISKTFTALLLADMVLKKEVNLNDPISKFLPPDVKAPTRNGKEITLLNLATHRSGLPRMPTNFTPKDQHNPYADYTEDQFYSFLSNYTLPRDIGAKFEYSNYGVALLGHILAKVAKTDYETLLKERICKVLGMNSTTITLNEKDKARLATGHNMLGKAVSNWDLPTFAGAGAIRSSVNDMLIFAAAQLGLVKTKLAEAITLTHKMQEWIDSPNVAIGLNWIIYKKYNKEIIWHNGGTGGYTTYIGLDEANLTAVVVLSNSANVVDDIGEHVLEPKYALQPYKYKWLLKDVIDSLIEEKGVAAAIEKYHQLKTAKPEGYFFDEDQLNNLGYELMLAKKMREAIAILKLNVEEYPASFNVYDTLGEAYMNNGDNQLATENYQKSIDINPDNTGGKEALKKLKAK